MVQQNLKDKMHARDVRITWMLSRHLQMTDLIVFKTAHVNERGEIHVCCVFFDIPRMLQADTILPPGQCRQLVREFWKSRKVQMDKKVRLGH